MASSRDEPAPSSSSSCPVDHRARATWLEKARTTMSPSTSTSMSSSSSAATSIPSSCDSTSISQSTTHQSNNHNPLELNASREISSIPRTTTSTSPSSNNNPANSEQETGRSSVTGNWIYPSEEMFFNAMRRKAYDPQKQDMKVIVPIHNAVNERAWKEIREWERGRGAEKCGGPRLHSFSGNSQALTPKARLNTLLGYTAPFDRHDWVVDRCGTRLEYVIDFYSGKKDASGNLSFYLDVRPKLNSWEGVKMRIGRAFGIS